MDTRILLVEHPIDETSFSQAGSALASGDIVAFPTETVYGLGASAFLPESVREIFRLKGRPADNPLIVHLLSAEDLDGVVSSVPPAFRILYEAFSPGPLTFVMPRGNRIPDEVSAGLPTVAVRFPSQPAARALLSAAGVPVVAPSANVSGRPSPTRARHVLDDFAGRIPWVIDDGPCEVGLESTVIDLTCDPIKVLRPGVVTPEAIYEKTGIKVALWEKTAEKNEIVNPPSPGMKYRHYAPKAQVCIVRPGSGRSLVEQFIEMISRDDRHIGLFFSESTWDELRRSAETLPSLLDVYTYEGSSDLTRAARFLFDALRTLDERDVQVIYAEGFDGPDAMAYMDRLTHAAHPSDRDGDDMRCSSVNDGESSSDVSGDDADTMSIDSMETELPSHGDDKEELEFKSGENTDELADSLDAENRHVLFICEGNTCRSPMAEALFNDRYEDTYWRAISAGLSTIPGWPVADHTVQALREFGIEAAGMRSQPVDWDMLEKSRLIITMTTAQRDILRQAAPEFREKIISMADVSERSTDIADPYGETLVSYRRVRDELSESLDDIFRLLEDF